MAIPMALMAAGTAINIISSLASNAAQAAAERENQRFYEEEAKYARESASRAESLAEIDYTTKYGNQVSAYASGNVDSSGSAAITMGGTIKQAMDEIWAIRRKGDMDVQLASMRGRSSGKKADTLGSVGYNLLDAGTTALNAYTKSEGFGQGFAKWMDGGVPPSGGSSPSKFFPTSKVD